MGAGTKIVGGVLAVGVLGAGAAAYEGVPIWSAIHTTAAELPAEIPINDVNSQTLICAAASQITPCTASNALGNLNNGGRYYPVSITDIPVFAQQAIIDTEDKRFYSNDAVDNRGLERALEVDTVSGVIQVLKTGHFSISDFEDQGGSTIENQDAGEAYPDPYAGNRLKEQIYDDQLGLRMDKQYSKKVILGKYLNRVALARGSQGIGSASESLYGKPITDFTVEPGTESQLGPARYEVKTEHEEDLIFDVAMASAPATMDVHFSNYHNKADYPYIFDEMKNLRDKSYHVEMTMEEQHDLSPEDATAIDKLIDSDFTFAPNDPDHKNEPISVNVDKIPFIPDVLQPTRDVHNADAIGAQQFVNEASEQAKTDLGLTQADSLPNGKVYTTLSLEDQQAAYDAFHNPSILASNIIMNSPDLNYGFTELRQDGSVSARLGSKDYAQEPEDLALGTEDGGSGRTAGSTLKSFFVAAYLQHGGKLTDLLHIPETITYTEPGFAPFTVDSGQGCEFQPPPHNVAPCDLTVAEALADSSDMLPILIAQRIGIKAVLEYMQQLGLPVNQNTPPPVMLGVGQFSAEQIAVAYSAFLNQGQKVNDYIIQKIVSNTGKILYEQPKVANREQVFSSSAATGTLQAEKDTVKNGTLEGIFSMPDGPRSVGGKTGTTGTPGPADDPSDLWAVVQVCDPQRGPRTMVVWVGNPNGDTPIYSLTRGGETATILNYIIDQTLDSNDQQCDLATVR